MTEIIYDRILKETDHKFMIAVADVIEDHVKRAVEQFNPEDEVDIEQVLADERTINKN